ncbi:MAG: metalloregulator ArsR/SmtB family transcription factor [Euryarchaeota archaeon]|nr:metalloregulator ArsR/SmtB family transcription factor [Euryarchaeota archaeon]
MFEITGEIEIPDSIRCKLAEKGGIAEIAGLLPDNQKIRAIVSVARALSDPVRVKVIFALFMQPMCVCLLVAMTGYAYSKMSYHLSVLKEGDLVCSRQEGNYLIYYPTDLGRKVVEGFKGW